MSRAPTVIGWVSAGLLGGGAALAVTNGPGLVVAGFVLILLGALLGAVALEALVGRVPSVPADGSAPTGTPRVGPS